MYLYQTEMAHMMHVHKSIQTAGSNYLFNWVALTGGGDVITLTKLNAPTKNQQTLFQ